MNLALRHDLLALGCAAAGVFILTFVGVRMLLRFWRDYETRYLEGAAVTLDAMYIDLPAQNLLYLSVVAVGGVFALVVAFTGSPAAGLSFALPAFLVPRIILYRLKQRRDEQFGLQLVDALMSVSNSLRAGFSLQQAFELLHREMPAPLSQEMRLVCQELRLGVSMDDALLNLYRRMPFPDVDLMVTAIGIVRDVGGNLTEVFENIADTIRERHRIEGKIRALTAQGRMQAIVVCLLPVGVGAALNAIMPEMFKPMYTTPAGWVLLGGVGVMMLVGILIIRKIVRIDV